MRIGQPRLRRAGWQPRIWHKLAIIGLAFTLPLATATSLLVIESGRRIEFSENELRGLEYLRPLRSLLFELAANRTLSRQVLSGQRSVDELRAHEARVDARYAELVDVDARLGKRLRTTRADLNASTLPTTQAQNWQRWKARQTDKTSSEAVHSFLISDVRTLIDYVGVKSNLVLDPKLKTYHLADALVVDTPELVDSISKLGDSVDELIAGGLITLPDRTKVAADVAMQTRHVDHLHNDLFTTFRNEGEIPDLRQRLAPELYATYLAVTNLGTLTTRNFVESSTIQLDRATYTRAVEDAVGRLSRLSADLDAQETRLLEARRAGDVRDRMLALSAVLAALSVSMLLIVWQSRRLSTDVGIVSGVATTLAEGDLTGRVRVRSRDEIGAMADAFNRMAERLQEMVEERQSSERTLRAERDFVDAVLNVAGSFVLIFDREGRIVRFNRTCETRLGYDYAEVKSRPYWELFLPPERRERTAECFSQLSASDFPSTFESTWLTRSGEHRRIVWSNTALVDEDGVITHVIATGIDVTARHAAEKELREAKERFQQAFDNASVGMSLVSLEGRIMQVNPALCDLLGRSDDELIGTSIADLTHPDDVAASVEALNHMRTGDRDLYQVEKRYLHSDGRTVWAEVTACVVHSEDDAPLYFVTQMEDITERREAEARLVHQALHDPLTGLPNRALLMDRLREVLARSGRRPTLTAVLFIDLDGFKDVNDSLGHEIGDKVLRKVARQLQDHVRPTDTVARLGGDEFVVLCQDLPPKQDVVEISNRLAHTVAAPLSVGTFEVAVTASIGIALARGPESTPEDLLRDADAAMYGAKTHGKNRCEVFDEALRAHAVDRVAIASTLRDGLRDNRFVLHFQPVVEVATGARVAVESLVRLEDPDQGLLSPGTFIQVAEDSGLIVPIGTCVLKQACHQLAAWRASGAVPPNLRAAVNLSARQAMRSDLVETVVGALAEADLDPGALALELTETALMEADAATVRQLEEIREMGVGLGIDDFGTGYSSLSYLKCLPVSFIKVDRSFVAGLVTDQSDREIVTAVIRLGQALGLTTVAEGVEDAAQFEMLRELGCDQAQGFLFGRPQAGPPDDDGPDVGVMSGVAGGDRGRPTAGAYSSGSTGGGGAFR